MNELGMYGFKAKWISAADVDDFIAKLRVETRKEGELLEYIRAYLHYADSKDRSPDMAVIHRCPVCGEFPSFYYKETIRFGMPCLEVSLGCLCEDIKGQACFESFIFRKGEKYWRKVGLEKDVIRKWNEMAARKEKWENAKENSEESP